MIRKISALGLDLGRKRLGVAGCDGQGLIATPLATIDRTSFKNDVEQLKKLVEEREAQVLVIGFPYRMDGTVGTQAREVQKLAYRLGKALELPVEFIDERLTSVEATEQLKAHKRFSTRNKGLVDRQAAAIILQQWLDRG
jgi:putative Holliday junction resolvase